MYQSLVKNKYPKVYNTLKQPMQWRMDTKSVYKSMGISGPSDLQNARTMQMLASKGIIVQNKGQRLKTTITSSDKNAMRASLRPGQIAAYLNKSGKVSFLGSSSGQSVGTSYTGGKNIPTKLSGLSKFLTTKNKGGMNEGSLPSN